MKLIVLSHHSQFTRSDESEALVINQILQQRLFRFHLRKPNYSEERIDSLISMLNPEFLGSISIHSHHHLADRYALGGVHFTEKDYGTLDHQNLSSSDPELNGYKRTLSTSFHSSADCLRNCKDLDYCFLSPVFDSISSPDKKSGFSLHEIESMELSTTNIFALGGINQQNALQAQKLGFSGIAIKGVVWNSPDPVKTVSEISDCLCH